MPETTRPGRVIFVGAGPGSPDLLTVRAVRCLSTADVIVHDALVPRSLLDSIDAPGERVAVPREGAAGADTGVAVGRLLVRLAEGGRTVARLKGGDPSVFARLNEELAPLRTAGIAVEFVPGVTAALAAAAAAGTPLTSRAGASCLTIVTGHDAREKGAAFDFAPLASLAGTVVVYMGVEEAERWSSAMLEGGAAPDTPVTIVSRCSWPDERVGTSTLARCAADLARHGWRAPAIFIVGAVGDESSAAMRRQVRLQETP